MNRTIFLLDSGAFSAWTTADGNSTGRKADLRRKARELYAELKVKVKVAEAMGLDYGIVLGLLSDALEKRITLPNYVKFIHENGLNFRGGAFNLDVIGDGPASYENWLELRRQGVDTIPVIHNGEDVEYLKKYMDHDIDYIAVGGVANLSFSGRVFGLDFLWKQLLDDVGKSRIKVHGLGLTDISIAMRYPWYSIDSTKSVITAAHGQMLVPMFHVDGSPNFAAVRSVAVSDQIRDHHSGKSDSFYGMPTIVRRHITAFVESCGYEIDATIVGRKLKQVRALRDIKLPGWSRGLGIDELLEDEGPSATDSGRDQYSKNVTRHWLPRFGLNLMVLDGFFKHWASQGHDVKMYNVCNGTVLTKFLDLSPTNPSRCLVSFARINDAMLKDIRKGVRGGNPSC